MQHSQREELSRAFEEVLGTTLQDEIAVEEAFEALPSQLGITWGSTWVRFAQGDLACNWGHACAHTHWGRVLLPSQYAMGRLTAGDTPDEIQDNLAALYMRFARGWRLSVVHCDANGQAEMQSTILGSLWPCDRSEYAVAQAYGFNGTEIRGERWYRLMQRRYRDTVKQESQAADTAQGNEGSK